ERSDETPTSVIDQRGHAIPGGGQDRPDEPINEKGITTRARAGDRQGELDAGNAVHDKVPRAVSAHGRSGYSSAASSSAWGSWGRASSSSSSCPFMICGSL